MPVTAFAPAKVNLYLHVTGRRADGFHLIDSLVAFADIGDYVEVAPATGLSLQVSGPEAAGLNPASEDNLVVRAARLLAGCAGVAPAAALHLQKNLPVASGIGGGSSDAAAALRALTALWQVSVSAKAIAELAGRLGADVPACVYGGTVWVGGVGERLEPAGMLPEAGILLVNPRLLLPTSAVFAALRGPFSSTGRFALMPKDPEELAEALARSRNDLTEPATLLVPEIGEVLDRLARLPGVLLARMSGSGATCFALFRDRAAAARACAKLAAVEASWWCAAGGFLADPALCR